MADLAFWVVLFGEGDLGQDLSQWINDNDLTIAGDDVGTGGARQPVLICLGVRFFLS